VPDKPLSFRREVASTVILQAGGALAMLGATLLLAHELGPVPQGQFSKVKAEVEFIAALAMLGLPQSLFYFIQSGQMSLGNASRWCAAGSGLAVLAGLIYFGVMATDSLIGVLAMTAAIAAFTWHGALRGVVLAAAGARVFSMTTALPQLLLFAFAAGAVWFGQLSRTAVAVAFTFAFLVGSLLGVAAFSRDGGSPSRSPRGRDVIAFGIAAGVAALGIPGMTFVMLRTVEGELGAASLGVFALSLTIAQGVLVPLNYVVPLLFKRWMERPGEARPHHVGASVALALIALAGLVAILGQIGERQALGPYAAVGDLLPILLLAAAADAYVRTLAVDSNAKGAPRLPAAAEVARLAITASIASLAGPESLLAFALVVLAGSLGSLALLLGLRVGFLRATR
jgi:hypothetical protein